MSQGDTSPLPVGLRNLVTQTDKDGNQIRVPDVNVGARNEEQKQEKEQSFFRQLMCCICGNHNGAPSGITNEGSRKQLVASPMPSQLNLSTLKRNPVGGNLDSSPAYGTPSGSGCSPQLEPVSAHFAGRICLALDLDETLVHSSFQPVRNADFVIPVVIDGTTHNVYVIKRPGVDEFLRRMGELYEVIIYTASLRKYADPLLNHLDIHKAISQRLYRENCVFYEGHYVKDLSLLNRPVNRSIIVDNSPMSYVFHPQHAIDCTTFIDSPADIEMWEIGDFLVNISGCDDVRNHCTGWKAWCRTNPSEIPCRR